MKIKLSTTYISLILYLGVSFALWWFKPKIMFHSDGRLKEFSDGTCLTFPIVTYSIGIIAFIGVNLITNYLSKR